jgi:hypothetical protein
MCYLNNRIDKEIRVDTRDNVRANQSLKYIFGCPGTAIISPAFRVGTLSLFSFDNSFFQNKSS